MDLDDRNPRRGSHQIDLKDYTADPSAGRISWRDHRLTSETVLLPKRETPPRDPRS